MAVWLDIRAAAPEMRVVQVYDRQFGYRALIEDDADVDERRATARANQLRIFDVLNVVAASTGGAGLLVGPKKMLAQMQNMNLIPAHWAAVNFGALRGVDAYGAVPVAVVVSRTLPRPADVERMAAVAFGRDVGKVRNDWYGARPGSRLMHDGSGAEASLVQHHDPAVEDVRWLLCEAEVQQAVGRVRGVRRTHTNPVLVLVLSDVDLGEIAVEELTTWDSILARCGPVAQMIARGVVPQLREDIVAACAPRWSDTKDAPNALTQWLAENPDAKAELEAIRKTGQAKLPWREESISMRPAVIGRRGRLFRRVWLAPGVDQEAARRLLDRA